MTKVREGFLTPFYIPELCSIWNKTNLLCPLKCKLNRKGLWISQCLSGLYPLPDQVSQPALILCPARKPTAFPWLIPILSALLEAVKQLHLPQLGVLKPLATGPGPREGLRARQEVAGADHLSPSEVLCPDTYAAPLLLQSMWRSQTALGPSTGCDMDPVLPVLSNKTFSHTKCKRLASQTLAVGQILPGVCGQGPSLCTVPEG